MSQKYDEYLEKHRQAVKKAYQWIAAYIPELTDVDKLKARYPDGFDAEHSLHRNQDDI